MTTTRRVALLLIASLILTTTAFAGGGGGGGTKRSSKIVFVDNSTTGIAVTTNTLGSLMTAVLEEDPVQVKDFLAAGGKFASTGGGTATFSVAAGTYGNVGATDQGFGFAMTTTSVTVAAGQTMYVVVTGDAGSLTLTVQSTP